MKLKLIIFSGVLAISLLSGCSQGEEILGRISQLLNQQTVSEKDSNEQSDDSNAQENSGQQSDDSNAQENSGEDSNDNSSMRDNSGESKKMTKSKEYDSDQGNTVKLPLGEKSFANSVIDFTVGDPPPAEEYANPLDALGEPDYNDDTWEGFVSLGGGGSITVEFEDAYLVNGPGDDLYIFEVGPSIESMDVEISIDGNEWIHLGEVSGGTSSIDIESHITSADDQFRFVRIIDLFDNTGGDTPGADLDAIAIINGVLK